MTNKKLVALAGGLLVFATPAFGNTSVSSSVSGATSSDGQSAVFGSASVSGNASATVSATAGDKTLTISKAPIDFQPVIITKPTRTVNVERTLDRAEAASNLSSGFASFYQKLLAFFGI